MILPMLKCRQCGSDGCGIWACRLTGIKNAAPQVKGHGSQPKMVTSLESRDERLGTTPSSAVETAPSVSGGIAESVDAPAVAAAIRLSSECYEEKLEHLTAK